MSVDPSSEPDSCALSALPASAEEGKQGVRQYAGVEVMKMKVKKGEEEVPPLPTSFAAVSCTNSGFCSLMAQ